MSMVPRPTATATIRVGGARRAWPWPDSIESGEKSPEIPANSAISESEMVRRRVVHSPPNGRSSKERGSIGRSIARLLSPNLEPGAEEGHIDPVLPRAFLAEPTPGFER